MTDSHAASSFESDPVVLHAPRSPVGAMVFASPHSGRVYSEDLTGWTRVNLQTLRRSEDAFVDALFADAPRFGAPLIEARFPRVFVDPNRAPDELDADMFDPPLRRGAGEPESSRAAAGLGVIARLAADGRALYTGRLPAAEAQRRLDRYYRPYHALVRRELDAARARFGRALLIDCHSMPSASARGADIVLGDRYGASCSRAVIAQAEAAFREQGFAVVRNRPYAGAFTTEHYGRPATGVEALQVEINRGLYLNELRVEKLNGFGAMKRAINVWIAAMSELDGAARSAAE
ncbi:MAG: N-formylglutamate amidohydrolase [Oceanicaulis sp.]